MSNTNIDDLSNEDLKGMVRRNHFVRGQLEQRVGALIAENIEMLGIIQDLQGEIGRLRHTHAPATDNGEVAEVAPAGSTP
jgi:hypothetical protein